VSDQKLIFNKMMGRAITGVIRNFLSREQAGGRNFLDPPTRDMNAECGYPSRPIPYEVYKQWFDEEGFATQIVNLLPDETWKVYPDAYEQEGEESTEFERSLDELLITINLWAYLHRLDKVAGIGRYGCLLLGFDDEAELDQPIEGFDEDGNKIKGRPAKLSLKFIRVFSEQNAQVFEIEEDANSDRFGRPKMYHFTFTDTANSTFVEGEQSASSPMTARRKGPVPEKVHWQRVLHFAPDKVESEIYGTPRLQTTINRCCDLRKILAGSGEMFYKGGYPGYSVESLPEFLDAESINKEELSEEFQLFLNHLQRFIAVEGVTIKALTGTISDPTAHVYQQLLMIAMALGCPVRILLGSESGQTTGDEEGKRWNGRIAKRQWQVAEPELCRELLDRLIMFGVLSKPKQYKISWKDLNALKETEQAEIALKLTQSLLQYVTSGAEKVMPYYFYLTEVLKWKHDLATKIIVQIKKPGYKALTEMIWREEGSGLPSSGTTSSADRTNQNRNGQTQLNRNTT